MWTNEEARVYLSPGRYRDVCMCLSNCMLRGELVECHTSPITETMKLNVHVGEDGWMGGSGERDDEKMRRRREDISLLFQLGPFLLCVFKVLCSASNCEFVPCDCSCVVY